MTAISDIPALRHADPATLRQLVRSSRPVRFPAGTVLRRAGEPSPFLLLLTGTVVSRHVTPAGGEVWPARWTGPTIVDKPALLADTVPATDLLAVEAGTARLLPRADFRLLLDREEGVRAHVLRHLARDALAGRDRLATTTTQPTPVRVAAFLLAAGDAGWRGSQEDLARVLGLSRVTVNRALRRLALTGAVRPGRRGVVVTDPCRLADLARAG
ncbi:Crp/Fnr family transcriptional regulator [Micromonospora echinaurantiaca]|uniref:Crp/Fnr family transcriptional regulator n=1 Tax=Micromonospora echinaurantiaca TaxID=47857 RepID=UPI00343DDA52